MRSPGLLLFSYFIYQRCSASQPSILRRQSPSPDPCGPLIQGQPGSPLNTCNGTKVPEEAVSAPAIYATYLNTDPKQNSFPVASSGWVESCMTSIDYICTGLDANPKAQWIVQKGGKSCTTSLWLPGEGGAETPTTYHCMYDVFFPMLKSLSEGKGVNQASINIAANGFPSGYKTGIQISSGYASWMIQLYDSLPIPSAQGEPVNHVSAKRM